MENPINHRYLEGIFVKLVDSSAVAQAKPSRSCFDPFERQLFCPFLIFKNGVFLSAIVNEFEFVYLLFSIVPLRWRLIRLQVGWLVHLENLRAMANCSCCRCQETGRSRALYRRHARLLLCLARVRRAAAC